MIAPLFSPSRPTLESLTGLRFVAALAVVLYHLPLAPLAPDSVTRLVSRGYLGVSLFFVLSGFILTYTYIDPETGSLRGTARAFWWARIARIYPVYVTALLLSLPIFLVFRIIAVAPAERPRALLSATLTPLLLQAWWPSAATQWNTPGWTLSVEICFYALFPLAAVWLARRRKGAVMLAAIVWAGCLLLPLAYVALTARVPTSLPAFNQYFWLQAVKFNPIAHLGEFALGVVAGLAFLRRGTASFLFSRAFRWFAPAGLVVSAMLLVLADWLPYPLCHNGLFAPLWAVVILNLAMGRGAVAKLLAAPPLVRLGEASYALYLVHVPLIGYHELARGLLRIRHPEWTVPFWIQMSALLLLAISLSRYLFLRVEEPGRRKIRAWTSEAGRSLPGDVHRPQTHAVPA